MLGESRLRQLLRAFPGLRLGVVGDFFLDAYYDCDPRLDERSLETGRTCYQVVRTRRQAGAAGTVAANLVALGVGQVEAVGFCGDDGEGYELRRAMQGLGLDLSGFFLRPDRFTPTYGKPCYVDGSRPGLPVRQELERLDTKNRRPTPRELQDLLIARLEKRLPHWHGAVLLDQVSEPNCGVLTARVRRFLADQARRRPGQILLADSRRLIGLFRQVMVKPNQFEAARALGVIARRPPSLRASAAHATALSRRTGRPVFLTLGERGMLVAQGSQAQHLDAFRVEGPIDPVGAGDSTSAALVAALSAGAELPEAGLLANLVASVTIQQLGTTGTASPAQILRRYRQTRHAL
jgi:rfaE bifunctional protein kinase chain/domain